MESPLKTSSKNNNHLSAGPEQEKAMEALMAEFKVKWLSKKDKYLGVTTSVEVGNLKNGIFIEDWFRHE